VSAITVSFAVVWAGFWVYWLASAVTSKRSRAPAAGGILFRLLVFVLVVVFLRANVLNARTVSGGGLGLQLGGLGLLVAGLGVAIWARVNLGRNLGVPMSEKLEPELVTSGPYHWIRHPIYTGLIVALLATGLALGPAWLIVAAILGSYFVYCALVEERIQGRLFPAAYPAYRASTKMLVPFLL
jgi:protein-S-isoprenylcysteine O-methyltransferase Ste14